MALKIEPRSTKLSLSSHLINGWGARLGCGTVLDSSARLVYKIHGREHLKAEGGSGKVILHPTSYDATHLDLEYNIGPGQTLDTDTYAVIVANLCGNGVSFSPSGSASYPKTQVRRPPIATRTPSPI